MSRVAWFTPLPPVSSGVARYSAELIPELTSHQHIDIFVDGSPVHVERPCPAAAVFSAHDFVWKHARDPYDLVIYQLGNARCHDYMWGYLARYPGLVVLHDGQFHHARALSLREQRREDDYREEFRLNHPDVPPDAAELAIAGWLGSLMYLWPMRRLVVESARGVLVHNRWLADEIRDEHPDTSVHVVDMGVADGYSAGDRRSIRARHSIPDEAVLFVILGMATPEKRIKQAIRALAAITPTAPGSHLMLVGPAVDHYDPIADARAYGIADRVTVVGAVPHEDLAGYLSMADVCLCLRWPTSRETSAAWLRCLAAGRATVVTDLVHMTDIPTLDPRSWKLAHAPAPLERETLDTPRAEPVAVSIDILDEDHSLKLAMERLVTDAKLRAKLGRNARALWEARFTLEGMASGYRDAIVATVASPMPDARKLGLLPRHLRPDGTEKAAELLKAMRVPESRIEHLWRGQHIWRGQRRT